MDGLGEGKILEEIKLITHRVTSLTGQKVNSNCSPAKHSKYLHNYTNLYVIIAVFTRDYLH